MESVALRASVGTTKVLLWHLAGARRAMGPSRGKYSRNLVPGAARSAIWVNDSPGVLCAALAAALREACKCNVCEND